MPTLRERRGGPGSGVEPDDRASIGISRLFETVNIVWLMGIVALLPMDFIKLPMNMVPVDIWILLALPFVWLFFGYRMQSLSLLYMVAIWLILLASFISTFAAPAPMNSFIVILKEIYAFAWFFTIATVLCAVSAEGRRRVLLVWTGAVFVHGMVIIAQFFSPEFWRFTTSLAGSLRDFEIYRPSGLFVNANSAAFFQVLGFVPLMLVSPSPRVAAILGVLLLPSVLVTGSMGATLALLSGAMIAIGVLSLSGHSARVATTSVQLLAAVLLLVSVLYFVTSHNERYQAHFERIFLGRAERSSGGRLNLWQRGFEVFIDHDAILWGVGPENFREVDGRGNQLHSDFIAFLVERGLIGTFGLLLLAGTTFGRAIYLIWIYNKYPGRVGTEGFVFLGAAVAIVVESLTHQVFHFREMWLVLAVQEAIVIHVARTGPKVEPVQQGLFVDVGMPGVTK